MKITKQRLKEIIREELNEATPASIRADVARAAGVPRPVEDELWAVEDEIEGDESNQEAEVRLQQVASSLGAPEAFVATVRDAITNAVSSEGMGWDRALSTMVDALEMLLAEA